MTTCRSVEAPEVTTRQSPDESGSYRLALAAAGRRGWISGMPALR